MFWPNVSMALAALRLNRFRSALTMLGIVIGVAAVIAMVAVGSGATDRIQQQIASMGSNLLVVTSGSQNTGGLRTGSGFAVTLTSDDAQAIAQECTAVSLVAPLSRGGAQLIYANNNWGTSVMGTTPDYFALRELQIDSGRAFTDQDVDAAAKVVVLGKTVADNLFGGIDPVGQVVRIKSAPFTVIGTIAPKGQSPTGQDQDDVVIVPLTSAKKKILGATLANAGSVQSILVQAASHADTIAAETEIRDLLHQRHRIQPAQDDDFTVRNLEELFSAQESSARVMSTLLAAIASVSLFVGGIGIMNIMMVSVTERTREIGIRKAIGARMNDILTQFLVEAVTLSVTGGLVGIGVGITTSLLISHFAGWQTEIGPGIIALSFVFAAMVGVFFGYYPARRAAGLDPITSLRYE